MAEIKSNLVDLEVVYNKLNATIDRNIDLLKEGATAVDAYNKKISVVPSAFQKGLEEIRITLDEVKNSNIQLTKAEKESANAILKGNQVIRSNIATKNAQANATKKAEAEAKRLEITNKNLASAYIQLSQREAESARRVQDLIARGRTATQTQRQYNQELRTAQREFDKYRAKVLQADKAVGRWNRTGERSIGFMRNLIGAFGIAGGVTLFATISRDIFQTTKELQSLDNALKQVTGTQEQFSRSQEFLRGISESFGLEINGLTKQFTQFYVSAKDKLSATEIENIFTSISKAGAVMGLSVDNQNRAFLALNQMMSKGTVQAEELRGQLGEALPGAFGIMAKAVGVTEKELQKMMKAGEVIADEVLPKFAKELEKVYGIENINRVETLAAAQNRLSNEWTEFIRSLDEGSGVVSNFFKTIISEISETIKWWRKLNEETGTFKENFERKTEQGFTQQLKEIQNEADKSGVSLRNLARVRQQLAVQERNELYEEIKLRQERVKLLLAENPNKVVRGVSGIQDVINSENEKIIELSRSYGYYNGVVKATNYILKNNKTTIDEVKEAKTGATKELDKNTKATQENKKAKDDVRFALIGSVEWFEKLKSALELEQTQLSQNSEKWQDYQKRIDQVQKSIDAITGASKKLKEEEIDLNFKDSEFMKDLEKAKELLKWNEDYQQGFVNDFVSNSGFDKIFELIENFDKLKVDGVSTALAISEAFQQAFNTISEASQANFDAEYERLEKQRDFAIEMAGGSATAKEEIDRQYDERKKAIQRREAEAQKRLAIFNIAIDTAQAIMGLWVKPGFPKAIPLAIAVGALGAAQIGMVASQPIPQFWKGGVHDGGLMMVNDGKESNYKETIVTPDGKIEKPQGKNVVLNRPKGTKIFTHDQWESVINKELAKNGIDNLGSYMNFAPQKEVVNSFDMAEMKQEFSKLASVIKNKDGVSISIDEKGFRKKQGNTEFINSRLNLKSRQV